MKKQFALIAIALSAVVAGTAVQAAEQSYAPPSQSMLTRAQVQADLAAWRAAGLAAEWSGDQTPDIDSDSYRSKFADYQQRLARQQASHSVAAK